MPKPKFCYAMWHARYGASDAPAVVVVYTDWSARVLRKGDKGYAYYKRRANKG